MDAQSYFDSQAHFNKWLKQLTEDEQRMIVDMLNEFRQQNSNNAIVSGSLPLGRIITHLKQLHGYLDSGETFDFANEYDAADAVEVKRLIDYLAAMTV